MEANRLSTKDLMVGDWVIPHIFDAEGKPSKIVGIHYNSYKGKDYVDWVDCEVWDELSLSDIEPIPLTPEILEKNGFKNGKLNVSPQYYLEDNDVFIGVTLKDIPDKHKGIDIAKGRLFFQLDVSHIEETLYVHTLQHALRLCGIEKEITL